MLEQWYNLTIISTSDCMVSCQLEHENKIETISIKYKKDKFHYYKFYYCELNHSYLDNLCDYNDIPLKQLLILFIENKVKPLPIVLKEYIPF